MNVSGTLQLETVEGTGLRFRARFPKGEIVYDNGPEAIAAGPMVALLGAVAACGAMDVISILRKKRLDVTGYEIAIEAARAEEHPKRWTAITLVHRVTGHAVPLAAVEEAVRLSATKYCGARATLDPGMPVTDRCEVIEG